MSPRQFSAVMSTRIPTPAEFVAFVEAQGWSIRDGGSGKASLRADRADPLAVALARMLSREPYRTNVLAEMQRRWRGQGSPEARAAESAPDQSRTGATLWGEPTQEAAVPVAVLEATEDQLPSPDPPPFVPDGRPREWLWRDGHRYTEDPEDEWLYGVMDRHPVGAWWWRWKGHSQWEMIEDRRRLVEAYQARRMAYWLAAEECSK